MTWIGLREIETYRKHYESVNCGPHTEYDTFYSILLLIFTQSSCELDFYHYNTIECIPSKTIVNHIQP